MLSLSIVEEIDFLLRQGTLSQRKIATHLGVSRGIVSAIARGRRGLHGQELCADGPPALLHRLPPARCPRCGYRVYMPCIICVAREYHERHRVLRLLGCDATHPVPPAKCTPRVIPRRRGRPKRVRRAHCLP